MAKITIVKNVYNTGGELSAVIEGDNAAEVLKAERELRTGKIEEPSRLDSDRAVVFKVLDDLYYKGPHGAPVQLAAVDHVHVIKVKNEHGLQPLQQWVDSIEHALEHHWSAIQELKSK